MWISTRAEVRIRRPMTNAAVLLSCHGTVEKLDDMAAFLANVRRGRPAPPELVREMVHRYEAIGGSPLMTESRAIARALEAEVGVPVDVAARLFHPYPAEVLRSLVARGAERIVSLPLAPQSVHVYHASVREAAGPLGVEIVEAPAYGTDPDVVAACVESIESVLPAGGPPLPIVLSAHSLPTRVLRAGDPYERDFREMAALVGAPFVERGHAVVVSFQSQGQTDDEWLGPDLPTTFRALAANGHAAAVVAPIGFVSEHIETLYDLDIEAPRLAKAAGLDELLRAPAMGRRPAFTRALARAVRSALARPSAEPG
jgi:ferrochelatase